MPQQGLLGNWIVTLEGPEKRYIQGHRFLDWYKKQAGTVDTINKIINIAITGNIHWTFTMGHTCAMCVLPHVISFGSSRWTVLGSILTSSPSALSLVIPRVNYMPLTPNSSRPDFSSKPQTHLSTAFTWMSQIQHIQNSLLIPLQKLLYLLPSPAQPSGCSGQNP